MLLRIADEVPHNQEVARKLHLFNACRISPLQPLTVVGIGLPQQAAVLQMLDGRLEPLLKSCPAHFLEVAVERVALRDRKLRERIVDLVQLELAALDKLHRAAHHFGRMGEQPLHLFGGLDVKLLGIKFEPLRIVNGSRGLHAQQHLVRVMIVFAQIVAVVGRHQRNAEFVLHPEHVRVDLLFRFEPVVLDLEEEVALAEDVLISGSHFAGCLVLPCHQVFAELACKAAGEADQSLECSAR